MAYPSVEKPSINVRVLSAQRKESSISQSREWRYRSPYSNTPEQRSLPPARPPALPLGGLYPNTNIDARHGLFVTRGAASIREAGGAGGNPVQRINVPRHVANTPISPGDAYFFIARTADSHHESVLSFRDSSPLCVSPSPFRACRCCLALSRSFS